MRTKCVHLKHDSTVKKCKKKVKKGIKITNKCKIPPELKKFKTNKKIKL